MAEPFKTNSKPDDSSQVRILIVEDSPTQALLLEQVLATHGYLVSHAPNGKAALEFLRTEVPALVITDVVMPEIDGYELCRRIRANHNMADLPVILLTDLSNPGDVLQGLGVGANNFIAKPFDEELLISRIQYILVNSRMRQTSSAELGIKISFAGADHFLTAERLQIIDFLISSLDSAVRNLHETNEANRLLGEANEKIRKQAEELRALSLTDQLTGLNNRRGFFALADQQLKIARRAGWETVVLFGDVDNFKEINDRLGHKEGDRALVDIANILRTTFRESDIIGRLGGDEFAILATGPAQGSALQLGPRFQQNLEQLNDQEGRSYKLGLSLGTAICNCDNKCSVEDLIHQADKMMYASKRAKRCCRHASQTPPVNK
jgi:diguanylate cyclase (GGDEF)-like protein